MPKTLAPLRIPVYRRIWLASVLSNFGLMIQGVGVAWAMVETADAPALVAWVQTATMLPLMLLSIPGGAIADVFNLRRVALSGLLVAWCGAVTLLLMAYAGAVTPLGLLGLCFMVGSGMAIYSPAWQASVTYQVPRDDLPQAIALNSISYNIARGFGPALGGLLVAWGGAAAAFLVNALCYLPLLLVYALWRFRSTPPRLPPERIDRAVFSGLRFVKNSPSIRIVVARGFICGMLGVVMLALMPLVAKSNLQGSALDYGILLGGFGIGAVAGAMLVAAARQRLAGEAAVTLCMLSIAVTVLAMALVTQLWLLFPFLILGGAGWMLAVTLLNISVQTIAPRWVLGRVLATFYSTLTGGMAMGSLLWGVVVEDVGLVQTLYIASGITLLSLLLGLWLRLPDPRSPTVDLDVTPEEINPALQITHRSGPIVIEKEYCIVPGAGRQFYRLMQKFERMRRRNGAYDWSLSRDITSEQVWIERYHLSTWLDYLRLSERLTDVEQGLLEELESLQQSGVAVKTRYHLERPLGSVRWREECVDRVDQAMPTPTGGA